VRKALALNFLTQRISWGGTAWRMSSGCLEQELQRQHYL
jgi:hypothetical protein